MTLYTATIAFHVVIAVLGTGVLGAIPIVAFSVRRPGPAVELKVSVLDALFRYTRWSFPAVFASGALVDLMAGGAFHETMWFRVSFGLLVLAFVAHGRARAALRRSRAAEGSGGAALRTVERWGWAACAAVAGIAVLMEAKPWG